MPTNIIEADEFTGDVAVPTPGDARTAASVGTAFQRLSNRTRFLYDRHNERLGVKALSILDFVSAVGFSDPPQGEWQITPLGSYLTTPSDSLKPQGWFPLNRWLVRGCAITSVSVRVKPRRANSGIADRMTLRLVRMPAMAAPANAPNAWLMDETGASATDNGTSDEQTITLAPGVTAVDPGAWIYALWLIGGAASSSAGDSLYGASITLA